MEHDNPKTSEKKLQWIKAIGAFPFYTLPPAIGKIANKSLDWSGGASP
jgi:hypothetical protein